ncbi:MAG: deoxyguanosinetriphosphate triphosphohydrolase [Oscillospiraceae bacterium]|nr:deoxyguanosinetriphosphate triphosphohydrolase [Oscillospiraceae bacterium]
MQLNIRKKTEEIEKATLSKNAKLSSETIGRASPEDLCDIRTEFQKDKDKIVHSKSFRRLKHKTQVFISPKGDHYRTRLTHTLEVSQIARTVARALRLNEDLTEAIALGHDLGHTPFGHTGEDALNDILPGGFRHFEQSVRVVESLENNGRGLNLTEETINGIFCHSNLWSDTFEGKIVRICDKIAYIDHDIDDAVRAGNLKEKDLPVNFINICGKTRSQRVDTMVKSLINGCINKNISEIPKMEPEVQSAFEEIHKFMYSWVYSSEILSSEKSKVVVVIEMLYNFFIKNVKKMSIESQRIAQTQGVPRAVADYLAGMTDEFAVNIYKDIFIPKSFSCNICR